MRSRSSLLGLVLLGMSSAITLAAAAGFYSWRAWRYYQTTPMRIGDPIYVPHPELGYELAPHVYVNHHLGAEITDERGARVAQPGAAPKKVDALVAGCSFSYGLGVPYELSFGALFGEKLGLSSYNLAVSGYGTRAARLRTERYLDLRPRYVVYGFIDDHLRRNLSPCATSRPPFCRPLPHWARLPNGQPEARRREANFWFRHGRDIELMHPFGWRDVYWSFVRDLAGFRFSDWHEAINTEPAGAQSGSDFAWERLGEEVREWLASADRNGFDLIFVHIPNPYAVAPAPERLRQLARDWGTNPRFRFVDVSPRFQAHEKKHGPRSLCLLPSDCHPGDDGHRLIAEAVAEEISKRPGAVSGRAPRPRR